MKTLIVKTAGRILLAATIAACNPISDENESKISDTLTKSSLTFVNETKNIDFAVKESDILGYIGRKKDSPEVLSIIPVERDGEILLYVVNYRKGWSIFSADKHLPPIVAEGQSGSFRLESIDNPGVLAWIDNMMDLTCRIRQEKDLTSANEYTDIWTGHSIMQKKRNDSTKSEYTWTKVLISSTQETVDGFSVGPFLQTEWGQKDPWNMRLPYYNDSERYPIGCPIVAVSQLLYWFNASIGTPSGLYHGITVSDWIDHNLFYSSVLIRTDFTDPSPRWAQMLQKYSDYDNASPLSVEAAGYVADLMTDVGNRVKTVYNSTGSSANINYIQTGLASFGLTSDQQDYCDSLAYNEIVFNQRPFYIQGFPVSMAGHAWVVDGLKRDRVKTTNTYVWYLGYLPGSFPSGEPATSSEAREAALEAGYEKPEDGMITHECFYSEPNLTYHMNWGWNGLLDGYFSMNVSLFINGTTYSFTDEQRMIYNIRSNANQ